MKLGLIPTPTVFDSTGASANMKSSQVKEGSMHSMTLARYVMLPTPKATEIEENYSDWKERMVASGNPKNMGKTTCNIGTMAISGMLPTPTSVQRDHPERVKALHEKGAKTMRSRVNGEARPNSILDALMFERMLPTPRANKVNGCDLNSENLSNRNHCNLEEVVTGWVVGGMPPTPTCNDMKNASLPPSHGNRADSIVKRIVSENPQAGESQQLNPAFVGEMMGFPPDWTINPFIHGGTEIGQPTDFSNFPQFNPTISKGEIQDMDGVTASKWRNESIKAYGNAIVPEVAYNIFQAINKYENR